MTLGDRVLDWLLRDLGLRKPIDSDLVLVHAHAALTDTPPTFFHKGEPWHFVAARGELSLREALLRGGRLVAAVPERLRLPLDLVNRAYARRVLTVEAHNVVAAVAGSPCMRLQHAALAEAIVQKPQILAERGAAWTFTGQAVTETEVKQVLVAAELGFDRKLERLTPEALLARWILAVPPPPALPALVDEVLRAAHGQVGGWLAWAARERRIHDLVAAGALAGTKRARALAPAVPGVADERSWEALRALVEDAVREAKKESPSAVNERLEEAERLARRAGIGRAEAPRHPLLRAALEAALFEHAEAAADGKPAAEAELLSLERNVHAQVSRRAGTGLDAPPIGQTARDALDLVLELGRVARFCNAVDRIAPKSDAPPAEWALFARDHVAWADMSARAARRFGEHAPADLIAPRRRVLERYLEVRDELNQRFAAVLAHNEAAAYRQVPLPAPLPLHVLTKALIRPLVEAEHRVFLLVLDGCDLASFYELLRNRPDDVTAGLALPAVSGQLGGDLQQARPLHVGLSPLPTVTSHARRALFAGEIPQNPVLDDSEASAANARADAAAWSRNTALQGIPHLLFLKGELGPDGSRVIEALEEGREQVIAAVFNGVDDALSSHETTAMLAWTWGNLGSGLKAVLNAAVRKDWTIVVTSDHGHTPFWSTDRKVAAQGSSQRYGTSPLPGAVTFRPAGLRPAPLHLLTAVGAFAGTQRRGFHGGAGLEEVIVPIALLGRVTVPELKPPEPAWWQRDWEDPVALAPAPRTPELPEAPPDRLAAPPSPPATQTTAVAQPMAVAGSLLSTDLRAAFSDQPRQIKVLELLAEKGVLTDTQVGRLIDRSQTKLVHGFMNDIQFRLHRLRLRLPFVTEEQEDAKVYRWIQRS